MYAPWYYDVTPLYPLFVQKKRTGNNINTLDMERINIDDKITFRG